MSLNVLNKESILKNGAPEIEEVEIKSLKGSVRISRLSMAAQEDAWKDIADLEVKNDAQEVTIKDSIAWTAYNLKLVSRCLVDDKGVPIFADEEGIAALRELSTEVIGELVRACQKVNKLDAKAVEEAEKNSEKTQEESSISDLPLPLVAR